jgi:hypothetical protein
MENIMQRFEHCDPRFYPHIEKVVARLPHEVKDKLLDDRGFTILAGDDLLALCVVRYEFDYPVDKLLYLNTKLLIEPEHRIIYTIAHEIARYVIKEGEAEVVEIKVEELLMKWGFEKELEAFRYHTAIAESEGYQIGYEWAKRHSRDYVVRHFGLYFDEWNEKGLKRMTREQYEMIQSQAATAMVDEVTQLPPKDRLASKKTRAEGALPRDEAIIAGIMAAVKEIKFRELYGDRSCDIRPRW